MHKRIVVAAVAAFLFPAVVHAEPEQCSIKPATAACNKRCQIDRYISCDERTTAQLQAETDRWMKETNELMRSSDRAHARETTRCYPDGNGTQTCYTTR